MDQWESYRPQRRLEAHSEFAQAFVCLREIHLIAHLALPYSIFQSEYVHIYRDARRSSSSLIRAANHSFQSEAPRLALDSLDERGVRLSRL
jgi:hypothetical protein